MFAWLDWGRFGSATAIVLCVGCFSDVQQDEDEEDDVDASTSVSIPADPNASGRPTSGPPDATSSQPSSGDDSTTTGAPIWGSSSSGTTTGGSSSSDTSSSEGPSVEPGCGNGVVDEGEDCDDENTDNNDGCLDTCKDRPILWFPFDGNAFNEGWLGPDFDGVEASVEYVAGQSGDAVAFGGNVTIPDTAGVMSESRRYTVSLWFREEQGATFGTGARLMDFRSTVTDGGIETYPGSQVRIFQCYSSQPTGAGCLNFNYTRGVWHHLLYRCNGMGTVFPAGCDVEIFFNGVHLDTFFTDGNIVFNEGQLANIVLGTGTEFRVDDFRIYDTVFDEQGQCTEIIGGTWAEGGCVLP